MEHCIIQRLEKILPGINSSRNPTLIEILLPHRECRYKPHICTIFYEYNPNTIHFFGHFVFFLTFFWHARVHSSMICIIFKHFFVSFSCLWQRHVILCRVNLHVLIYMMKRAMILEPHWNLS